MTLLTRKGLRILTKGFSFCFAFFTLAIFFTLFTDTATLASGPSSNRILNYQIRLTDPNGIAVPDGTEDLQLTVYTASSGGSQLYSACTADGTATGTPTAVVATFTGSAATVLIGDTTVTCASGSAPAMPSDLFNNTTVYLGVTVNADAEMTPRKRIVATGYALNADRLDDLDTSNAGGSNAYVPVTDSSGNFTLTKNVTLDTNTFYLDSAGNSVGIGTTSPTSFKLQVAGDVGPDANDTYNLGSNTLRWKDVFVGPSSIHVGTSTSDEGTISYDTTANVLQINSTSGLVDIGGGSGSTGCTIDGSNGNLTCSGTIAGFGGGAGLFIDGGNTLGAAATLGTNDNYALNFETNNTTRATIDTSGNFLPAADDTYNFGSTSARWKALQLGSNGVAVHNDNTDTQKLTVDFSGANAARIASDATSTLQITTGANIGINVDTNGNIGIGTTTPIKPFDLRKNQNTDTTALIENYQNAGDAGDGTAAFAQLAISNRAEADGDGRLHLYTFGRNYTTNGKYVQNSGLIESGAGLTGGFGFSASGTGTKINFYTDDLERMRITDVGYVGIGTKNPTSTLEVVGDVNVTPGPADTAPGSFTVNSGFITSPYGSFGRLSNRITYSEQFDNAAWNLIGYTTVTPSFIAPDGTTAADKLNAGAASTDGIYQDDGPASSTITTSWIGSVWLRTTSGTATVNLKIATSNNDGTSTTTPVSLTTTWKRYAVLHTFDDSGTGTARLSILNGTNDVYVWGAQLENVAATTGLGPYVRTEGQYLTTTPNGGFTSGMNRGVFADSALLGGDLNFLAMQANRVIKLQDEIAGVNGDSLTIAAGAAGSGNQNGGDIVLLPGAKTGSGVNGAINFNAGGTDSGNTIIWKIPQQATGTACGSGANEGVMVQDGGGIQRGHICIDGSTSGTPNKLRFYAESFASTATDLAEMYSTHPEEKIESGDVVELDSAGNLFVAKTKNKMSSKIFGVIATNPGLQLSGVDEATGKADTTNGRFVALKGRVPVKVSIENGPIVVGDYLTSSSTPGVAMRATDAGQVIGRALDALAKDGTVRVFVEVGYWSGNGVVSGALDAILPDLAKMTSGIDLAGHVIVNVGGILGANGMWSIDSDGKLIAKEIEAEKVKSKDFTMKVDDKTQNAGEGMIAVGSTNVTVTNPSVKATSGILVTFYANIEGQWWISRRADGTFDISLSKPATTDYKFQYLLVNIEDARTSPEAVPPLPPTVISSPAPEAAVESGGGAPALAAWDTPLPQNAETTSLPTTIP